MAFALLMLTGISFAQDIPPFLLDGGDYRWVPLNIRQTPVRVEVTFRVSNGQETVHAELLPEAAFRPMQKGLPHQALGATTEAMTGAIERIIEDPGIYRVVIANKNGAKPALVTWRVSTALKPSVTTTELTPKRRMGTILVSFLLFFAMVGYSGWKLRKSAQE